MNTFPEETVYEMTKVFWEHLEEIKKSHSVANHFDPKFAVEEDGRHPSPSRGRKILQGNRRFGIKKQSHSRPV